MSSAPPSLAATTPSATSGGRVADAVVTGILLVLVVGAALVLGLLSMFTVMAVDACGAGLPDEPAVCEGDYMGAILVGYWAALVLVPLGSITISVVAMVRRRLAWPWALAGLVGLVGATVVYGVLLSR